MARRIWAAAEVRELGVATDVKTAASVLGIGRTTAYALVRAHDFPVPVLSARPETGSGAVMAGESAAHGDDH